ncbi:cystathionine beta-synthase [Salinibacterium sp. dk2585]|uniref:cystathionine beta-synthase n=1 Tax=unclassified Salinibacterium TaxID=2632331 RepID=UPI0011C25321|nr:MULTISPECIES: cystathionine beta-synthase [unclassified Salinibacterium]QEE60687.1 cystathionine beta-synthase [Salinibacterium sp. dk2585]TXK55759.1 cystathionine beta-synthase [Salinibacterium sp. dk5596]
MKYAETVLDLVGNTPLVKLNKVTEGISATVLVKVEYLNPGGSSKDRIATKIIDAAEASGDLKPGGTIVEPTSGNTGVGLALVAQQRGYRCVFVCPDKVGEDKRNVLRAYGAEVIVTPTAVAPDSPESYYSVSDRLAREIPGAFKPNQYENQNGPLSHYETTGPEIWRDTDGRVTHFIAGVGTGGTISGTGKYLKEVSNGAVRVVGSDPEGSVYSGGTGRPYLVEGVGEDFWPGAYDPTVVDDIIMVTDVEAFHMTRRLALEEGLLVGGSSGMAVVSALKAAKELGPDDVVVVLLPDGGRGYLGKLFNENWIVSHGFGAPDDSTDRRVAKVLHGGPEELAHVRTDSTVRDAVKLLASSPHSAVPVLSAAPPVVLGEVVGSVSEASLVSALLKSETGLDDPVDAVMSEPLEVVGACETLDNVEERLVDHGTLLVLQDGKPVGLLGRRSLLAHFSV